MKRILPKTTDKGIVHLELNICLSAQNQRDGLEKENNRNTIKKLWFTK